MGAPRYVGSSSAPSTSTPSYPNARVTSSGPSYTAGAPSYANSGPSYVSSTSNTPSYPSAGGSYNPGPAYVSRPVCSSYAPTDRSRYPTSYSHAVGYSSRYPNGAGFAGDVGCLEAICWTLGCCGALRFCNPRR